MNKVLKKYFNRNDLILICILLIFISTFYILSNSYYFVSDNEDKFVDIYIANQLYETYHLNDNRTIDIINGDSVINTLIIEDGKAYMTYATCPDKLCIRQKSICHNNESICCLPNAVYVNIRSIAPGEYDAITQ